MNGATYSSIRREGIGTCTVVQGKGGGGSDRETGTTSIDEGPRASTKVSIVGLKEFG